MNDSIIEFPLFSTKSNEVNVDNVNSLMKYAESLGLVVDWISAQKYGGIIGHLEYDSQYSYLESQLVIDYKALIVVEDSLVKIIFNEDYYTMFCLTYR